MQDFTVPATMDKSTETSININNYEMYDNSPDSTTSSTVSVKKEPPGSTPGGFEDAQRRASI